MFASIEKTAKCSVCATNVELIVDGRKQEWRHHGLVPGGMHDATPNPTTIKEAGR